MEHAPLDRRRLLASAVALAGLAPVAARAKADPFAASPFRRLSEADWRRRLPPASFAVLRQSATERAFSSPLDFNWKPGTYHCLGCGLPLFSAKWKFESHTGWPSFWTVEGGAVATKADFAIGVPRTEYHCARCLGHQGHVFHDGPPPTGLRYCNNGLALKFVPA